MSQPSFIVDHASKNARPRPEPLAAGFFGQRGSLEPHIAENRAEANGDLPSLDQFEDHYGHFGLRARPKPPAG